MSSATSVRPDAPPASPRWFVQLPLTILRDHRLKDGAIRLWCALRHYADDDTGECYPTQETLAADIGASVCTVHRHTKALVKAELLTVTVERTDKGTRNHYRLHLPPCKNASRLPDMQAPHLAKVQAPHLADLQDRTYQSNQTKRTEREAPRATANALGTEVLDLWQTCHLEVKGEKPDLTPTDRKAAADLAAGGETADTLAAVFRQWLTFTHQRLKDADRPLSRLPHWLREVRQAAKEAADRAAAEERAREQAAKALALADIRDHHAAEHNELSAWLADNWRELTDDTPQLVRWNELNTLCRYKQQTADELREIAARTEANEIERRRRAAAQPAQRRGHPIMVVRYGPGTPYRNEKEYLASLTAAASTSAGNSN